MRLKLLYHLGRTCQCPAPHQGEPLLSVHLFLFLEFYFKSSTLNDKISEIKQGGAPQSFKYVETSVPSKWWCPCYPLWGTQIRISVPWVYSKNYFLFPATTLTHSHFNSVPLMSCYSFSVTYILPFKPPHLKSPSSVMNYHKINLKADVMNRHSAHAEVLPKQISCFWSAGPWHSCLGYSLSSFTSCLWRNALISHTSGVKSGFHFSKFWPPLLFQCGTLPGRAGHGTCLAHPGRLPFWSAPWTSSASAERGMA